VALPVLARLELESVGIHTLRHSAAAALISAGASPEALQAMLGHSSAGFSLTRYGHLFDADLDALAARLDDARREFSRPARGLAAASER
jgi:integrase